MPKNTAKDNPCATSSLRRARRSSPPATIGMPNVAIVAILALAVVAIVALLVLVALRPTNNHADHGSTIESTPSATVKVALPKEVE